ncbi:MAG TPA: riboflavin synthase [Gemmatimonadaceae bacterium]|nr:riboflavin synthase [Gemmatimonadaceae bacterium]
MFTGLVDDVGTIEQVAETDAGREFRIRCGYAALQDGESIAVNGACLTVREHGAGWFTVGAVVTTLGRTAIGEWREGRRVNLERAMRLDQRLGGHMVLGHVDGVARVAASRQQGDAWCHDLALPAGLGELMVMHGSLTVDGVSLTVNDLPAPDIVQVSLIEYTRRHTTLGALREGDAVHVEADVIGKYVQRMVAPWRAQAL